MGRIIILLAVFLASCASESTTEFVDLKVLPISLIYTHDSVENQIHRFANVNKKIAESYFERSQAEQNPERAIFFCKRAITLEPTNERYLALSKLLAENNLLKENARLLSFLLSTYSYQDEKGDWQSKYMFGKQKEDVYYENIVNSIRWNQGVSGYEIYMAREEGIDVNRIKERLIKESRLALDPNSEKYKNIMLQFLDYKEYEAAANNHEMFMRFANSCPDSSEVFSINEKAIRSFNYSVYNGYEGEFDEMTSDFKSIYAFYLPEKKESPNVWLKFETKHKLQINDEYTGVIYALDSSQTACPVEMREIYQRLVTYDRMGKIIDHMVVSQQTGSLLTTAVFDHNEFTLSYYERVWKKPYSSRDFDNELLETKKVGEAKFEITDGVISKL